MAYRMLEPWRAQWGLEYESRHRIWGQRFAGYAAADFSTMQERDWRVDVTVNVGIVTRGGGRTSRIFLEWHDGRPTVNEFFNDSESTLTLGQDRLVAIPDVFLGEVREVSQDLLSVMPGRQAIDAALILMQGLATRGFEPVRRTALWQRSGRFITMLRT